MVVNLILINMMMAIINLAFEEIKENADQYKNKFELMEYIKRSAKEMIGITVAEPIVPVYMSPEAARRWRRQQAASEAGNEDVGAGEVSTDFSQKTDALLDYIKRVYLADGFMSSEEGKKLLNKMELSEEDSDKMKNIGFDALFMSEKRQNE